MTKTEQNGVITLWPKDLISPLQEKFATLGLDLEIWCVCVCACVCVSRSVVSNSATPWAVSCQFPLSMEFSRQEYLSRLPFPSPAGKIVWCQSRPGEASCDSPRPALEAVRERRQHQFGVSQWKEPSLNCQQSETSVPRPHQEEDGTLFLLTQQKSIL